MSNRLQGIVSISFQNTFPRRSISSSMSVKCLSLSPCHHPVELPESPDHYKPKQRLSVSPCHHLLELAVSPGRYKPNRDSVSILITSHISEMWPLVNVTANALHSIFAITIPAWVDCVSWSVAIYIHSAVPIPWLQSTSWWWLPGHVPWNAYLLPVQPW